MADTKISDMTTASSVGGTDFTPIVQSGTNKKATFTVIKNFLTGFFAQVFTDLTDVPSTYTGQSLKGVRVNTGETALEFFTATGGGDALTSNPLSQFASTTSLQLKGVIADETGSGALVFGTSPAITTPTGIVKGDIGLGSVTNDAQTKAAIVPNTAPSAGQILAGNAGGTAFAPVSASGDATLASTGAITIANDVVTYAKFQNAAANTVITRAAGSSGDVGETALSASQLLGRGSTGDVTPITLGTALSMSGTTLNAATGSVAVTADILKGDNAGNAVALGSATSGKVLKSNGTNFIASTETYAAPSTIGNVLTSDGTNWTSAAPAGSGGGTTSKVSGSDFTTSSTTLVNITGLTFAASANTKYEVDVLLAVQSTSSAGAAFSIAYSAAGATGVWVGLSANGAGSGAITSQALGTAGGTTIQQATTTCTVTMKTIVVVGANPGNITIQGQKQTSGTLTVYIGSRMTVTAL